MVHSGPDRIFYFDHQGRRRAMPCSRLGEHWSGNVLYVERPQLATSLGFSSRDVSDEKPRVQFETLFIDKGDIATKAAPQTVQFEYPFRNLGKSDLLIKKVHTNCACLVAKKPEQPIGPEGTATITLQYSIDQRRSSFLHEAVVETNDPTYPVVALRAAGNTDTVVTVSPAALDLGSVALGEDRRSFLVVRYSGEEDFAVRGASSTLPYVSLKVHETVTKELAAQLWPRAHDQVQLGRGTRILEVVASPTGERLGESKGEIAIETNIAGFEKMTVPLSGRIVPPVAAVPSLLSFGEVEPGERLERSLLLVSSVKKPFRVVAVTPEAPGIEWKVAPSSGDAHPVQLRISALGAAAQGLSGSSLHVRIESDGKQFDLGVPVFAGKKAGP